VTVQNSAGHCGGNGRQPLVDLSPSRLIEYALRRGEGVLTDTGALAVVTGSDTGRSPDDTMVVGPFDESGTPWPGSTIRYIESSVFEEYWALAGEYLAETTGFAVTGQFGNVAEQVGFGVRVVTENAWHALFSRIFLWSPSIPQPETVLEIRHAPKMPQCGLAQDRAILVDLASARAVIAGTNYAGEIKNVCLIYAFWFFQPPRLLALHAGVSVGSSAGDVAMFIGCSSAGKTTLAALAGRSLLGDDAHVWTDRGLVALEAGCYATALGLSSAGSGPIRSASTRFGALLQNVVVDETSGKPDFDSPALTANTCAAFPSAFLPSHVPSGLAAQPRDIFLLTYDTLGAFPPIAKLTEADAVRMFALGYSGYRLPVEMGPGTVANQYHPCFASPFIAISPKSIVHAFQLRLKAFSPRLWLLNTGLADFDGALRPVPLALTQRLVRDAIAGNLVTEQWWYADDLGVWTEPRVPGEQLRQLRSHVSTELREGLARLAPFLPTDLLPGDRSRDE
jgi:phosphoenolpyruvate carboxykinase (ATP)